MWTIKKAYINKDSVDTKNTYQKLLSWARSIINKDRPLKFYNEGKQMYLETDISGLGLGVALLQVRDNVFHKGWGSWELTAAANSICKKNLTNAKMHYSNIERQALGILHGLERFHHYCCAHNISVITDHKVLVAIFNKDIATLCHTDHIPPKSPTMHPSIQHKDLV